MTFSEALEAMKANPGKVFTYGDGKVHYRFHDGRLQFYYSRGRWLFTGPGPLMESATDWRPA